MRLVKTDEIQKLFHCDYQRAWAISREPERFGLPREVIVRVGRSVFWNLDLVEEFLRRGGSPARSPKHATGSGSEAHNPATA